MIQSSPNPNEVTLIMKQKETKHLLQALYEYYLEFLYETTEQEQQYRDEIDQCVDDLPFERKNTLWIKVFALCCELERKAYLQGLHSGAQLIAELLD